MTERTHQLPALEHFHCFGCDPRHEKGLRLTFFSPAREVVRTEFTPSDDHVGSGPLLHGGIVATLFDEVMAWCLLRFRQGLYVTARLELRFRQPAFADSSLIAEAKITGDLAGGIVTLSGRLFCVDAPTETLAEASGVFVEAPQAVQSLLPEAQRAELRAVCERFAAEDQAVADRGATLRDDG